MVNLPFTPNHVLLVNGCYPPSAALLNAGPEYRPNAQELSRLTYYASNHPGKITKLGNELEKRVRVDSRKAQGRNLRSRASLLVTLAIYKALVTECKRDIALLSTSLMSALHLTLTTLPSDLEVCARVATVFLAWAARTDGAALVQDPDLTKDYTAILRRFAELCVASASKDEEDRNRTRLIGVAAVSGVVSSQVLYHSTQQYVSQVSVLLPPLLALMSQFDTMVLEEQAFAIRDKPSTAVSPTTDGRVTRPPIERRTQSIHLHIDGDKGPSSADVANECLRVCATLFNQSNSGQVGLLFRAVLNSLDSQNAWGKLGFCCWFSQKAVEWTQFQYRYAVPMRLVERLQAQQDAPKPTPSQYALAAMIATVFTSPMPLINLSTSDVVSNLITVVLHRAVLDPHDGLLPELVKCIAALGTHVYYADQVHDLAGEIISRLIALEHNGVFGRGRTDPSRTQAIRCLLAGLVGIIRAADHNVTAPDPNQKPPNGSAAAEQAGPSSAGTSSPSRRRTRITPDAWQDTLTLLCDADFAVRAEYSRALIFYLRNELPEDGEYFDDDGIRHVRPLSEGPVVPPENLSSDSTARFLHAVHASLYVLATSACVGLVATSTVPSAAPSVIDDNEHVNVIPSTPLADEPQSAVTETTDLTIGVDAGTEDGEDLPAHMLPNRRASVSVPGSRKVSVAQRILDQTLQQALGAREPSRANASDFAFIAEILAAIHQRVPCRALFTGVPMTYALGRATKIGVDSPDAVHRALALSNIVARTWSAIGKTWGCEELSVAAKKTLSSTKEVLPSIPYETSFTCTFSSGVPLPTVDPASGSSSPDLHPEVITGALSTNALVHSASGLDEPTIRDKLGRFWTVEIALKNSVETLYDVTRGDGISPLLKISPTLTHIENVSMASLARSHRRVGVSDLREALEGRNSGSNTALVHRPASLSTFDHSSVGGDHSPSSARPKRAQLNRGSEVRDVLNRLGIGKQNPENLLKASFPALQKQNSRSTALIPPYKT